jgi:NADPH2:quinone reductase
LFHSIADETIEIAIGQDYPLEQAAQAHRDLEGRKTVGSVVLTP